MSLAQVFKRNFDRYKKMRLFYKSQKNLNKVEGNKTF